MQAIILFFKLTGKNTLMLIEGGGRDGKFRRYKKTLYICTNSSCCHPIRTGAAFFYPMNSFPCLRLSNFTVLTICYFILLFIILTN
jgi:hypothetical protein